MVVIVVYIIEFVFFKQPRPIHPWPSESNNFTSILRMPSSVRSNCNFIRPVKKEPNLLGACRKSLSWRDSFHYKNEEG